MQKNFNLPVKAYSTDSKICVHPSLMYKNVTTCVGVNNPCKINTGIAELSTNRGIGCFTRRTRADRR